MFLRSTKSHHTTYTPPVDSLKQYTSVEPMRNDFDALVLDVTNAVKHYNGLITAAKTAKKADQPAAFDAEIESAKIRLLRCTMMLVHNFDSLKDGFGTNVFSIIQPPNCETIKFILEKLELTSHFTVGQITADRNHIYKLMSRYHLKAFNDGFNLWLLFGAIRKELNHHNNYHKTMGEVIGKLTAGTIDACAARVGLSETMMKPLYECLETKVVVAKAKFTISQHREGLFKTNAEVLAAVDKITKEAHRAVFNF